MNLDPFLVLLILVGFVILCAYAVWEWAPRDGEVWWPDDE